MAAIATTLIEFADNGNSRTLTAPAHSALKPAIVIQKRKVATNMTSVPEDSIDVIYGTTDSEGKILVQKVAFSVVVKRPIQAQPADVTAAKALFREIVASNEFDAVVSGQLWIK